MDSKTQNQFGHRAGRYMQQPQGYRAFIPASLPPEPPIAVDDELLILLLEAQAAVARLDGAMRAIPNPEHFMSMYIRREAVLSSRIEGTQSTIGDLLAAEAQLNAPPQPADVQEVANYVRAMRYGLERLETLPVSVRLIREIHALLLDGVRGSHLTPGELRRSQNWIGRPGSTLATATFVPPPAHAVPDHLADLEQFLHSHDNLPLLLRIGMAHVQFEMIHPFLDGNGRVGRLLITLMLSERGELIQPVLYLSEFFERNRDDYYRGLRAVQDDGDWEGWLRYFLRGVTEVAHHSLGTAASVLRLREADRNRIVHAFHQGSGNALKVLEALYQTPIRSVADVQEITGLTIAPANRLVARLVEMGILVEITGQRRNRYFRYDAYVRLFDEESRPLG
jgi:Fic family protein